MIMYIKVTIFCSIIIATNNYFEKQEKKQISNLIKIIGLLFIIFSYIVLSNTKVVIIDQYLLFYSMMYLLGYITAKYKITFKQMIIYEMFDILL